MPVFDAVAALTMEPRCSAIFLAGPGASSGISRKSRRSDTNTGRKQYLEADRRRWLRSFRHSLRRIPVRDQAEDLPVILRGCIRAGSRWSTIGMGKAKSFYRHGGFVESPVDPITMMMLTGDM